MEEIWSRRIASNSSCWFCTCVFVREDYLFDFLILSGNLSILLRVLSRENTHQEAPNLHRAGTVWPIFLDFTWGFSMLRQRSARVCLSCSFHDPTGGLFVDVNRLWTAPILFLCPHSFSSKSTGVKMSQIERQRPHLSRPYCLNSKSPQGTIVWPSDYSEPLKWRWKWFSQIWW